MSYSPAFTIPRHAHECAFFGFVLEGTYTENYERRSRECNPSSLLFHPEGEVHSEVHENVVVRIFSVEPAPSWLEQVHEHSDILKQPFACQGGPVAHLAVRLYREFREQDALTPIALEGLLLELLATVCRQPTGTATHTPPQWLRQARDMLQDQFAENLSLQEIACAVGVHPAHLARSFRQHFHCTVGDYLRNLRIEQSRHVLATSDTPLSEIALDMGYSDQSHFTTAFKRHTGISPGQYRKLFSQR
jgi:AraC family transcriptional regulator